MGREKERKVAEYKMVSYPAGGLLKILGDHMIVADVSNEIVYLAIYPVASKEDIPLCGFAFSERSIIQMLSVSVEAWRGLLGRPCRQGVAYIENQFSHISNSRLFKAKVFLFKEHLHQLPEVLPHFR